MGNIFSFLIFFEFPLFQAFPCISTGVYNFPKKMACDIALGAVKDWLSDEQNNQAVGHKSFRIFWNWKFRAF